LAENPEGLAPQGLFSCCTYLLNSQNLITDQIERIVVQLINLKKQNPEADISELEAEIDRLVYELYGLSDEEIGIVEGVE
jgi:hypothetical protein